MVSTEGSFISVTNYTPVLVSLRHLLLDLFWHFDQTKSVEHPIDIRHAPDVSLRFGSVHCLSDFTNIVICKQLQARLLLPSLRSTHIILDLLLSPTYRLPKTVSAVRIYRDENIFSVCPRCDVCIEREYQGYCHRCGQHLDWSRLEDAEEIFIGWSGVKDDD